MSGISSSLMLQGKRIRPEKPVIKGGIFPPNSRWMLSDAMSNPATQQSNHLWEQASSVARQRVDALIARLPEDLRREASELECEFLRRCDDPNAQDTMGGYSRSAQRIRLYL